MTSQESWSVKAISNLTKIIEKNIKIYDIKLMYYENITRILNLYNNVIILLYKFGQI